MKAITYTKYGPPEGLQLEELPKPVPTADQVLIRVEAASVNRSDWEALIGHPLYARLGGLFRPAGPILGSDVAGRVEAVGRNNRRFKPGDEVFGLLTNYRGGFAEYVCSSGRAMALKPAGMSFEEAAALPQAAPIALQGIRDKGQVGPGQKVLVNGAGGGAGTFAVQLARLYGAEVTGVDSAAKFDFLRSLGAEHVIDYTQEDFTRSGQQYDMILDVVAQRSVFACKRALRPGGSYYVVGGSMAVLLQILLLGPWIGGRARRKVRVLAVGPDPADLVHITELIAAGKLVNVIDRRYPLSEVPEALRYLGEGRSRGKVVISVAQSGQG